MGETGIGWASRITGFAEVAPTDLLANGSNWRIHPNEQQALIRGSLDKYGWVKPILVQEGSDLILDGHARVFLAERHGQPTVPVQYVRCTPEEADELLALLDTIPQMAVRDEAQWAALAARLGNQSAADDGALASFFRTQADAAQRAERAALLVDHTAAFGTVEDEAFDDDDTRETRAEVYATTQVRQIMLLMNAEEYARMLGEIRHVMEREGLETTYDVVRLLLDRYLVTLEAPA